MIRGLRYTFVVDDVTSTFTLSGLSGELVTGTSDGEIEFTPESTTPDTIYYTNTPAKWGDTFLAVSGLALLPSLTSIYFPAFGHATDPEIILNSGYYQPYTSGYGSGTLSYYEQRRDYATHLKH